MNPIFCHPPVPRNLAPWKHAKRLRINLINHGTKDRKLSDSFWTEDGENLLADFLTGTATRLECFETNWGPILGEKRCLSRFACMRVGFKQDHFGRWPARPSPDPDYMDQPLYRNVRRLRAGLRTEVASRTTASVPAPAQVSLSGTDVKRVCSQSPFENDSTWSSWIQDTSLLQEVADTFNACPTAMDKDMAWNPIDASGSFDIRRDWPLGAEIA